MFTRHWRPLLLVFLITAGVMVAFYTYTINAPAIVKSTFGSDRALTGTWINLLGLILLMVIQPIGGLLSDRLGRKAVTGLLRHRRRAHTYVLLTYLPHTTSPLGALTAVGYVILTGYTSVNAIVKAELFPAEIRALGVGLGYALANSAFGGTAPLLYQAAKSGHHVGWFIAYVTTVIAVSLLVYVFALKNKALTVLDREQGSAWALPAVAAAEIAQQGGVAGV